jgi:outer membrane protein TolC
MALAAYPAFAAAEAAVDRAEGARREAEAGRYPSLRVGASLTRFDQPMIVQPLHGFDPTRPPDFDRTLMQGEATLSYTLFDGGERAARVLRADADLRAAGAGAEGTRAAVTAQVAATYLAVLSAGEVAQSHERRLEALEEEERRVRMLLAEGQAPEIQLLRVEAALEAAEAEAVAARGALATAELELARLTGASRDRTRRDALVGVTLRSDQAPTQSAALGRALAANPEVEAARRALDGAKASASMVRTARWPKVDAFGTYWERGGGEASFGSDWGLGLRVSYPLFTGGAVRSQIQQAEAGVRGAEERVRLAEFEAGRRVDAALAAVAETRAKAAALDRAVERQEAVVRTERVALEIGAGVQTDFLAAQADLLAARAGLARARHAEMAAHIEVARLLGMLDEDWIRTNLEW